METQNKERTFTLTDIYNWLLFAKKQQFDIDILLQIMEYDGEGAIQKLPNQSEPS